MRVHLIGDSNAGHFSELLLKIKGEKYSEAGGKMTLPPGLDTVVRILKDFIKKLYFGNKNLKD